MSFLDEHPLSRAASGLGGFLVAAFGPSVVPDRYEPWLVLIGVLIMAGAVAWPALARVGPWYRRHIAWRLASSPPDQTAVAIPPASPAAAPVSTEPRPTFEVSPTDEFPYAYPKAVLKAAIENPRGTRERPAGAEDATRMTIVMRLVNDHGKTLKDVSVILTGLQIDGNWLEMDEQMKIGNNNAVSHSPTVATRFALIRRDISDPVTPQPFLMRFEGRDYPLQDNATYVLRLELRCRYPLPTIVLVQIDTGERLDAEARILSMEIAKEPIALPTS